jgi:hypothetical protein
MTSNHHDDARQEARMRLRLKKTEGLIFGGAMHNNVIYPSLKRFVRNGWVEQSTVPGDRIPGGPVRPALTMARE